MPARLLRQSEESIAERAIVIDPLQSRRTVVIALSLKWPLNLG
jgi:hypothetical protein